MKRTTFKRMLAGALSCMMLSAFSFTASAEESVTTPPMFGDANSDGIVNAVDSALIVLFSSLLGPWTSPAPEEYGINLSVSDINADTMVDAKDAALLLHYCAEQGAGYTGTLSDFVENEE